MVILDLPSYNNSSLKALYKRQEEFDILLKTLKMVICILSETKSYKNTTNYGWLSFGSTIYNNLHKTLGETLIINKSSEIGKLFEWFEDYDFEWKADILNIPTH